MSTHLLQNGKNFGDAKALLCYSLDQTSTLHFLSSLISIFLLTFQSDLLTGIFNPRLWPSRGPHGWGNVIWMYILQKKKGRQGRKGPLLLSDFSKGYITSKKQKSTALIFFHFSDISHSLWMLTLSPYNSLSWSWDWVAFGVCFQKLCEYSTGIFPGTA